MPASHETVLVDEGGVIVRRFEPGLDTRLTNPEWSDGSTCLRFVDAYGDTIFNQLQLPVLRAELEAVATRAPSDLSHAAMGLSAFLRACEGEPHTYLKILGD